MFELLAVLLSLALVFAGYSASRRFVRERLRFVDAVQRTPAPWVAGIGATLLASVVTALLPLVGLGTAIGFGIAVGSGVAAGARDVRRGTGWIGDGR